MNAMTKNGGPALCEVKSTELQAVTGGGLGGFGGLQGSGLPNDLLVDTIYKPWLQFVGVQQLKAPPPKG